MLEFGIADPIQVHAVEACIMWPAASGNRTIGRTFLEGFNPAPMGLGRKESFLTVCCRAMPVICMTWVSMIHSNCEADWER